MQTLELSMWATSFIYKHWSWVYNLTALYARIQTWYARYQFYSQAMELRLRVTSSICIGAGSIPELMSHSGHNLVHRLYMTFSARRVYSRDAVGVCKQMRGSVSWVGGQRVVLLLTIDAFNQQVLWASTDIPQTANSGWHVSMCNELTGQHVRLVHI